ncbi:MAG TPA: hypothetical protein P5160_02935 [Candidatus Omnitrophota bacterium]|nr:hypothetical protein [Candidatus Omnitrophota bacterium]
MGKRLFVVFGVAFLIFTFSGTARACGCGGSSGQSSCHGAPQVGACGEQQDSCQESSVGGKQQQHQRQTAGDVPVVTKEAVNAGNKICPVMGGKVDGKTAQEFEGRIYNLCCPGCIEEFKKDPRKYIQRVNEELKPS